MMNDMCLLKRKNNDSSKVCQNPIHPRKQWRILPPFCFPEKDCSQGSILLWHIIPRRDPSLSCFLTPVGLADNCLSIPQVSFLFFETVLINEDCPFGDSLYAYNHFLNCLVHFAFHIVNTNVFKGESGFSVHISENLGNCVCSFVVSCFGLAS